MARPEGFEPPTAWFVARYSIQLSYGRIALSERVLSVFVAELSTTSNNNFYKKTAKDKKLMAFQNSRPPLYICILPSLIADQPNIMTGLSAQFDKIKQLAI